MVNKITVLALAASSIAMGAMASTDDVLGLPNCVKPCTEFSVASSDCDRFDLQCVCRSEAFETSVHKCLFAQCQPHEYAAAFNYMNVICPEQSSHEKPNLKNILHKVKRQDASSSVASSSSAATASSSGSAASGTSTATSPSGSVGPTSAASPLLANYAFTYVITVAGVIALAAGPFVLLL